MEITILLPAYNEEQSIGKTISKIKELYPAFEVLVIDDGSTDTTADVVRSFGDEVVFIQQFNAGASAARNAGIQIATGDWIAFLDADDEWLPYKLKSQCEYLQRYSHLN